jgi:hypothetical protein
MEPMALAVPAMDESLMTIVLESLAFFALANDDQVDPDAAAEQTEGAAQFLRRLSPAEKQEFANFARHYADDEERSKGTPERVEFFRAVPETFELEG